MAPTSPWNDARRHASVNNRSIPDQIEYWSRIGKLAEENPDLPYEFIKGILLGLQEIKDGDVREDKTPWRSLRPRNSYVNSSKDPESITSYILQTSAVDSNVPFTFGNETRTWMRRRCASSAPIAREFNPSCQRCLRISCERTTPFTEGVAVLMSRRSAMMRASTRSARDGRTRRIPSPALRPGRRPAPRRRSPESPRCLSSSFADSKAVRERPGG